LSYFVALDLPTAVREELMLIASGVPGAHWVDEERLHLTLRYLGPVDGQVLRDLQGALSRIEVEPFALQLQGIGFFPPRGAPENLWVGVVRNEALERLRARIDSLATRLGVTPDRRRYTPHVTLARLHDAPASRLARYAAGQALWKSPSFVPASFSLYSSHRRPDGTVYQRELLVPIREQLMPVKASLEPAADATRSQ